MVIQTTARILIRLLRVEKSITCNSCVGSGTKATEFLNAFHGLKPSQIVYVKSLEKIAFRIGPAGV